MLALKLLENRPNPLKLLCLGSHSDDIEIGCGGTILRLGSLIEEFEIVWIVFGASGEREQEARKSAALFSARAKRSEVMVESFRDGFFPYEGTQIKTYFETLKQKISPDLIFTHNRRDAHQDHRLIAELTWNTFRDHLILEYEIPKYDGDLGQPNLFIPLDKDIYEKKVGYVMSTFQSQRCKHWFREETFLSLMRLRGMECNAPSGYAEGFYARKLTL